MGNEGVHPVLGIQQQRLHACTGRDTCRCSACRDSRQSWHASAQKVSAPTVLRDRIVVKLAQLAVVTDLVDMTTDLGEWTEGLGHSATQLISAQSPASGQYEHCKCIDPADNQGRYALKFCNCS